MNVREYYLVFLVDDNLNIVLIKRVRLSSFLIKDLLGSFCILNKRIFRCRSPPLINSKF